MSANLLIFSALTMAIAFGTVLVIIVVFLYELVHLVKEYRREHPSKEVAMLRKLES